MPVVVCKSRGQTPVGVDCEAFDRSNMCCTSEAGSCECQRITYTDEEIRRREQVPLPPVLLAIRQMQEDRSALLNRMMQDLDKEIEHAYKIIDQMNPLVTANDSEASRTAKYAAMQAYWDDMFALERDMGILSSLNARIAMTCGWAEGAARKSESMKSIVHAQKFTAVKKSYELGLRTDRSTDMGIEHACRLDPDLRSALEIYLSAFENHKIVSKVYDAVENYINVLKKRIESLREERREAGRS